MPIAGTPLRLTPVLGVGAGNWAFKLDGTAIDTTTRANFETSTTYRYLQAAPGTITTGVGVSLPTNTATGKGWNILPADMDVAGERRVIPAGTWTCTFTWIGSADATSTTGFGMRVHFYRRSAAGVYTFIEQGSKIDVATPPALAATIVVPVVVATDQLFAVGETLHMEVWIRGRGQTLGQNIQFQILASGNAGSQLALPATGLRTNMVRSHVVTGAGTVAAATKAIRYRAHAVSGLGVVAYAKKITAARSFAVTGLGVVTKLTAATRYRAHAVVGVGSAAMGRFLALIRSHAVSGVGTVALSNRKTSLQGPGLKVTGIGVVAMARRITGTRAFAVVGLGVATMTRIITSRRSFAVVGVGLVALQRKVNRQLGVVGVGVAALGQRTVRTTKAVVGVGVLVVNRVMGKLVAATGIGTVAYARRITAVRAFAVTGIGSPNLRLDVPEVALDRVVGPGAPTDWPQTSPVKTISGVVRDAAGAPYAGATVQLVRESDGLIAATTASGADGTYAFTRGADDPHTYRVVAWEDTGTPTQGVSGRGLVGV